MLEMKTKNNDTNNAIDLEGARRATGESLAGKSSVTDPQVVAKSERRRFTSKYKLSVLEKADQCTGTKYTDLIELNDSTHKAYDHTDIAVAAGASINQGLFHYVPEPQKFEQVKRCLKQCRNRF